jgi:hypothetical protein
MFERFFWPKKEDDVKGVNDKRFFEKKIRWLTIYLRLKAL